MRPNAQERFISSVYSKVLMNKVTKVLVLLSFAGLAAGCVVSALNITEEFRREWFLPTDSYLWESIEVSDNHFSSFGAPVGIYATDVSLHAKRAALKQAAGVLASNSFTEPSVPITDWPAAFATYLTANSLDYDTISESDFNGGFIILLPSFDWS